MNLAFEELPCLLADEASVRRQRRIEQDHGLAVHGSVLGRFPSEHIHAGVRDHHPQVGPFGHQSVGYAGTVHVQTHPRRVGGVGQRGDLIGAVHRAKFGDLTDRNDRRLGVMLITQPLDPPLDSVRCELPIVGRFGEQ